MNLYERLYAKQNARNDELNLYYSNLVIEELKNVLKNDDPSLYETMREYSSFPDKNNNWIYGKYEEFIRLYNLDSLVFELENKYNYNSLSRISKYINFSLSLLEDERSEVLKRICYKLNGINSWIYNKDGFYVIDTAYGTFRYHCLTDFIDIERVLDELGLDTVEGNCHALAFHASRINDIAATGIERGEWPGQGVYHSWIECNDGQVVLDMTKNLLMPTEDYYKVFIDQKRIINKLTFDELCEVNLNSSGNIAYLLWAYINREKKEKVKIKK